jgi:hypothetical protein
MIPGGFAFDQSCDDAACVRTIGMGFALSISGRSSLAEFSRLYVQSRIIAAVRPDDRPSPRPQIFENGLAVQVSRGMSKGDRDISLEVASSS